MAALAALQNNLPVITLADLPPITLNDNIGTAPQIAAHLRKVLYQQGAGNPPGVLLPTVVALAGFFKRNELDVLDALFELKRQDFEYLINGLDYPVILKDPMARMRDGQAVPNNKRGKKHMQGIRHQYPYNPLWDIPGL